MSKLQRAFWVNARIPIWQTGFLSISDDMAAPYGNVRCQTCCLGGTVIWASDFRSSGRGIPGWGLIKAPRSTQPSIPSG